MKTRPTAYTKPGVAPHPIHPPNRLNPIRSLTLPFHSKSQNRPPAPICSEQE